MRQTSVDVEIRAFIDGMTADRSADRAEIGRHVEEFLSRGGRVEILPAGPDGFEPDEVVASAADGLRVGLRQAAEMLGMSREKLRTMPVTHAPPFTLKGTRRQYSVVELRQWARAAA